MKKLLAVTLTILLILVLSACTQTTVDSSKASPKSAATTSASLSQQTAVQNGTGTDYKSTVKGWKATFLIGSHNPLSGSGAPYGTCAVNGMLLAVAQKNAKGGILGAKIETKVYDDENNTEKAVQCATRLIKEDKVDALLTSCTSGSILASGPVYEAAKIPCMAPGNASSFLQQGWTYLFRCTLNNDYNATSLLTACSSANIKSIFIFHGAYENGVAGALSMEKAIKDSGADIKILGKESYETGDVDFSGQINKIVTANPDAVYVVANGQELGPFAKQLRANGYNKYILGTSNWVSSDVLSVAGNTANNVIFSAPCLVYEKPEDCPTEEMKNFTKAYMEMFGKMPENEQVYRGYDGANLLFEAIERAKSFNGTDIRDTMYTINNYVGLMGGGNTKGTWDFTVTHNGEGLQQTSCWIVQNGKFVSIKEYFKK